MNEPTRSAGRLWLFPSARPQSSVAAGHSRSTASLLTEISWTPGTSQRHRALLGSSSRREFFALLLIDASIIGASAVTLATFVRVRRHVRHQHSLHRPWREAKPFYASYSALVALRQHLC